MVRHSNGFLVLSFNKFPLLLADQQCTDMTCDGDSEVCLALNPAESQTTCLCNSYDPKVQIGENCQSELPVYENFNLLCVVH